VGRDEAGTDERMQQRTMLRQARAGELATEAEVARWHFLMGRRPTESYPIGRLGASKSYWFCVDLIIRRVDRVWVGPKKVSCQILYLYLIFTTKRPSISICDFPDSKALFGLPHIRLVRLIFSAGTIFFSHKNSVRTVFFSQFQPKLPANGAIVCFLCRSIISDLKKFGKHQVTRAQLNKEDLISISHSTSFHKLS